MTKFFLIAEKGEQAGKIATGLGLKKAGGCYTGSYKGHSFMLVSCAGHLLALKEPKELQKISWFDPKSNLPLVLPPFNELNISYSPKNFKQSLLKNIAVQFKKFSPDKVVCATDPDDEGAIIFYNTVIYLKATKLPLLEVSFTKSLEKGDIEEAFAKISEFNLNRYYQGMFRTVSDWQSQTLTASFTGFLNKLHEKQNKKEEVLGYFKKYGDPKKSFFSVGRVQTFALNLVKERTDQHYNFKKGFEYLPVDIVDTKKSLLELKLSSLNDERGFRFQTKEEAHSFISGLKAVQPEFEIDVSEEKRNPNMFYSLITLQKACSSMKGKEVMDIADDLRLNGGYCCYIRGDFSELPESMRNKEFITSIIRPHKKSSHPTIKALAEHLDQPQAITRILGSKKYFTSKNRPHHGAINTDKVFSESFSSKRGQVYFKIILNTFLTLCEPCVKEMYRVTSSYETKEHLAEFSETYSKILDKGYLAFAEGNQEKEFDVKQLVEENLKHKEFKINEIELQPPKLLTELTLKEAMAKPFLFQGEEVLTEETKKILKDCEGIGRPSSRDDIIEKILSRGFITREKGKSLIVTPLGRIILQYCLKDLYSMKTTANYAIVKQSIYESDAKQSRKLMLDSIEAEKSKIEGFIQRM